MGSREHLRSSLASRLLLASMTLLLPLFVFVLILVEERNTQIRVAETEIAGIEYLVDLRQLLELIPRHAALHQRMDSLPPSNNRPPSRELQATITQIDDTIDRIVSRALSEGDPFELLHRLEELHRDWDGVDHTRHGNVSYDVLTKNGSIQEKLVTLFRHVGNTANLELDASLDTTHLTRLIIHELPRMVAQLNSARTRAVNIVSHGNPITRQESNRLSVDDWALTLAHDNLFYGYNVAVAEDPDIARNLASKFETFERDTNAFHAMLASGELRGTPDRIFELGSSSIAATFALFDEIVPELFRILDNRVLELERTRWVAIASIIASTLIASLSGYFLMRALTRPLQAEISERRRAETKLGELAAIVEQSADSILTLTEAGIVTSWNSGAERLYGFESHEIMGQSISCVAPDGYENETASLLRRCLAGEQLPPHETVRQRKDGSLIEVSLRFSIVREDDGTTRGVAVIARDISERKRAEAELLEKERQLQSRIAQLRQTQDELSDHRDRLEELVRSRTAEVREKAAQLETALQNEKEFSALQRKFISVASHEFRTPLAIIDGAAQRIERRLDDLAPEELAKRTSRIRGAVARMLDLIESTLSASRLDEGRIQMKSKPVDLRALLEAVCERQSELCETLSLDIDLEDLPPRVDGDPSLLDQVFTNLISNAVKYSPEHPDISIAGSATPDGHVRIEVADNGVGIPKADLSRLFDRFFRASTSEGIPGTGIGLNLARDLVVMHGGNIDVESEVGVGTTFSVTLPVGRPLQTGQDRPWEKTSAAA